MTRAILLRRTAAAHAVQRPRERLLHRSMHTELTWHTISLSPQEPRSWDKVNESVPDLLLKAQLWWVQRHRHVLMSACACSWLV